MALLPLAQRLAAQPGRNGISADLWAVIDSHLADHGATADVVTAMRAELARGHVLLLLDGLDEVAGGDSRRQVIQAVQAFAAEQPRCRMVVACRVRAYEGEQNRAWQLPGWPTTTLADWTPGQVRAFIGAWYAAAAQASHMPAARRDERIAALQRAAAEREDLRRLSIRPLLLTIMALVHLNDGRLPEDRVTLYSRCLDILLGQWEIAGKDETVYGTLTQYIGLPDADVKSLRPLLARVAFAAHQAAGQGEVGRLRRADLRELVADALDQLKHPNPYDGAKRFLEYTDVRAGLLQASAAGDAYAFPHQTFQEYLAGLELIGGVDFVQRIMAVRADDRWRVPIMLGIGHLVGERALNMPFTLLSELLDAEGRAADQAQRDLVFAAELAEDVTWERLEQGGAAFKALRRRLAEALAQVVEGTALPAAERVHAGTLLGRLGDPRQGVCTLPPAMVAIEGGSFVIGLTPDELRQLPRDEQRYFTNAQNERTLELSAVEIARYPVTNAQFARFLAANGYDPAQPWWDAAGRAWLRRDRRRQPSRWEDDRFGITRPNHPVVGVTWYEAMAFCRWLTQTLRDGHTYTLPSEAEWEVAARGRARRPYPWGPEEPDGERANFKRIYNGTTAVGCFPRGATPEGVCDLAGNVWEWTRSEYRSYPYDPDDGRETPDDPAQKRFTRRGGGWDDRVIYLRASRRGNFAPDARYDVFGFRFTRRLKV
jgi:formylglycine-generating enzyme required for sulfatase activity